MRRNHTIKAANQDSNNFRLRYTGVGGSGFEPETLPWEVVGIGGRGFDVVSPGVLSLGRGLS